MQLAVALTLQLCISRAIQHSPASWGHYDVCKSQLYTDDRLVWHYMACQPESTDMTKYVRVNLEPENITCGDPPEIYCALVSALFIIYLWFYGLESEIVMFTRLYFLLLILT